MSCNVAFIGLGVMGYPMAGYISKGGHNVTVFNRTKSKAEKWIKEYKGKMAETPAEAAKNADFVFTCVGNDNDLSEVTIGKEGIYNTIKKGAVHIDNTTASAEIARKLYKNSKNIKIVLDAMYGSTNEQFGTSFRSRHKDKKYRYAGKTGTYQVRRITEKDR